MFKHLTGFFIVAGSILIGCVYYWMDHGEEVGDKTNPDEMYWNPIEEAPKLSDLLKNDELKPSQIGTNKTFLLIADLPEETMLDQMILAHYEPNSKEVKMNTLPSDEFQQESYSEADINQLKNLIEEKYDLTIDHTVALNLQGFSQLIDDIVPNGIELTITDEMVQAYQLNTKPGTYTLHGKDLLSQESDFNRVILQPEVLGSIKESIMNEFQGFDGMLKLPGLIRESQTYVQTDMEFNDLLSMVSTLAIKGIGDVETIPVDAPVDSFGDEEIEENKVQVIPLQAPVYKSNYQTGL